MERRGREGRRETGSRLACALGVALTVFLASQVGCHDPERPRITHVTDPERPFLYEAEFARDPTWPCCRTGW